MLSFPVICNNDNPKTFGISSVGDYLGIPTGVLIKDDVSALPFAAYQKVWYDYYRDQNLQDMPAENVYELVDGINPNHLTFSRNRAWEHDYFTSSLPFAQKGDPVNIPLSLAGEAKVFLNSDSPFLS